MSLLGALRAQVEAETRTRLRSAATLVAVVALLAASFAWIPDPASKATSMAWRDASGQRVSGIYNAPYVGAAAAMLGSLFLSLIGFYLVAGSVRRDHETGVGTILAATPLPGHLYLCGKFAAHFAYLLVLGGLSLLSAGLVFARWGVGPWSVDLVLPALLMLPPSLAMTAAAAVLFDVTPGLRGPGGYLAFFFAWAFLVIAAPFELRRRSDGGGLPLYDPAGFSAFSWALTESTGAQPDSISMGIEISDAGLERVPWSGLPLTARFVSARAIALAWVAVPLGAAFLLFDRFDPARQRRRFLRRSEQAPSGADGPGLAAAPPPRLRFHSAATRPGAVQAVLAEARMIWLAAGWLRWPLALAALAGAFRPEAAIPFLLLLTPVLSEVAARETLHGARDLVFSQPAVPSSTVGWKTGAALAFTLALGAPALLRASLASPAQGLAMATGLAFVAGWAVAAGAMSRGGKLFSATHATLWYLMANGRGVAALDYCGVWGAGLDALTRLGYVGFALGALALATVVERRRRDRGDR